MAKKKNPIPKVGIALVVKKGKKILLHKRKSKHANGHWGCPGGHLESWEEFDECALRELYEEAGDDLVVTKPVLLTTVNTVYHDENKHYVTVFMICEWISGEPQVTEPHKCEAWDWFAHDELPSPLMQGVEVIKSTGLLWD